MYFTPLKQKEKTEELLGSRTSSNHGHRKDLEVIETMVVPGEVLRSGPRIHVAVALTFSLQRARMDKVHSRRWIHG